MANTRHRVTFWWAVIFSAFSVLGLSPSNAAAQTFVFNEASFASGKNPQSVVSGDFNGDGKPDLAIANYDDNTVSILLGNGDGTFRAQTTFATGPNPIAIVVGDFNGDKILDLAVLSNNSGGAGSVTVLLGNGAGGFSPAPGGPPAVGNNPRSIAAADFNGDGKLDLGVSNANDDTVSVLLGNGDGTFNPASGSPVATGKSPQGVVAADFNGDSKPDLAIVNQGDSTATILLGNGDGTFSPAAGSPVATGSRPIGVVAGDFNGDGKLDLVTANSGANTISVLLGNGDGTFQPHADSTVLAEALALIASDFNGDGKLDVAVTGVNTNSVSILLGNGNGTFQPEVDAATGTSPDSLATVDLNGDGKLDLAIANAADATVSVLLGHGDGTFQSRFETANLTQPVAVAAGDFNEDGKADLAVAIQGGTDNMVAILLSNGDGTFSQAPGSPLITGNSPSAIAVADFNRDGHLDLAITDAADDNVAVFLGHGDGTFSLAPGVAFPVGKDPVAIAVADFNADKKPDLAVANGGDNTISILLGDGTGRFNPAPGSPFPAGPVGTQPAGVAAGDFNGDRAPDLAVTNEALNMVSVFLNRNDGRGEFGKPSAFSTGTFPVGITTADFNGDGILDLAVADSFSNQVSVLLGTGVGTFPSHVEYATASSPSSVVAADFNGDGKLDLALGATSSFTNRASVLLGNGDGTFQTRVDHATGFGVPGNTEPLATGDFNGDGSPDLALADERGNTVSVFLNTAATGLYPTSLAFGNQPVGSSSPVQMVALNNPGSAPLNISSITITGTNAGDFAETNSCGAALPIGGNCAISVTFTPTVSGTRSATLTLADNAPTGSQSVVLGGTGTEPVVVLNPPSLTFAAQPVGSTSPAQVVTLQNTGNAALNISSIAASGDFAQTNTCGSSVNAGASCTISVTFTPTAAGTRTGAITITDNASPPTQTVPLKGTGTVAPAVSLSPLSLTFAGQNVGTTSAPQVVTLKNTGNATLNITSILASGDFGQANTCGLSVQAGASCTISVTFTPTAPFTRNGAVTITDNASPPTQTEPLSGTGLGPAVTLSPVSLVFVGQNLGTTSAAQKLTLTNTGNATLSISSIVASGDFGQVNTCGSSVQAGASCAINVTFTPTAPFTRNGAVTLTDNASPPTQTAPLTGTGVGPAVTLSPTSLNFGNQAVENTSLAQAVTLSNAGNAALNIASIVASGDFAQTNTCGTSLNSSGACIISVSFTPTLLGARSGSITITDNASPSIQTVTLTGTGTGSPVIIIPASLTFGNQAVGSTSPAQVLTLRNAGTSALSVSSIVASGDFAETNTCGSNVNSGALCAISVTFTPTTIGTRSGAITVTDNAPGAPQTIPLSGTGIGPVLMLSSPPTGLTFGSELVGMASPVQIITATNTGSVALTLNSIAVTGANSGDFSGSNTCSSSLGVGKSCTITVGFDPTATGGRAADLTISDNAVSGSESVSLTGTGIAPAVTFSSTGLSFASQILNTSSAAQNVTLQNSGTATLSITSISVTGSNRGDFAETNQCSSSLPAGASCTLSVTFTPTAGGTRVASVSVADNVAGGPQTVALTGQGADFSLSVSGAATVSPGQTANYTATLTPIGGFNQTVSLACSGAPQLATCTVAPSSATPNGRTAVSVSVSVSTTAPSGLAPRGGPWHWPPLSDLGGRLLLLAGLGFVVLEFLRRRRRPVLALAIAMLSVLMWASCGGGASLAPPTTTPGTAPGTYSLSLTGTAASLTHSASLSLTVQ